MVKTIGLRDTAKGIRAKSLVEFDTEDQVLFFLLYRLKFAVRSQFSIIYLGKEHSSLNKKFFPSINLKFSCLFF